MLLLFGLYVLFVVLPAIKCASVAVLVLGGICCVIANVFAACAYSDLSGEDEKEFKKWWIKLDKLAVYVFAFCVALNIFIPSKQAMGMLVGGYFALEAGTAIAQIENIENLPPNVVNAANKFLEEYLNADEE